MESIIVSRLQWDLSDHLEIYRGVYSSIVLNNLREGLCIEYNRRGDLKEYSYVRNGRLHGPMITYFPNGEKHREQNFRNGIYRLWHENGNLDTEGEYLNGREGLWKSYYCNGIKEKEGYYNNGLKYGKWFYWYADGTPYKEGNYVDDKEKGEWFFH